MESTLLESIYWSPSNETASSIKRINLQREETGYGFSIVGGTDSEHLPGVSSPFISAVSRDGAADRQGLKEGDRLLTINGIDVTNLSHDEVIRHLKESNCVQLELEENGEERLLTESMASRSFVMPSIVAPMDRTAAYVEELQEHSIEEMEEPLSEVVPSEVIKPPSGRSTIVMLGAGIVIGALAVLSFKHGRLLLKIGGFQ